MSEALRQQPEEYFPSSEVEPLREARSKTLRKLADFLVRELPQIEAVLAKYGLHKNGGQALCEYASRSLQDRLRGGVALSLRFWPVIWWWPRKKH